MMALLIVRKWRRIVCIAALVCAGAAAGVRANVPVKWAETPYKYIIVDQDIRQVLTEFGRNLKISVKMSPRVEGQRIRGSIARTDERKADRFLQDLCDAYGLVWYFDGTILYIASEQEVETELIMLRQIKPDVVLRRMKDMALTDPKFLVRVSDDGQMLSVSGPPQYRAMVRQAVSALQRVEVLRPAKEIELNDPSEVRVFRGGS